MEDRAAQFSPFAALTGFDAAIEETGRLTNRRPELLEYGNSRLDQSINQLMSVISRQPLVSVTWFVSDGRKEGGHCKTTEGHIQKIDLPRQILTMTDGRIIPLEDILRLEGPEITDPDER